MIALTLGCLIMKGSGDSESVPPYCPVLGRSLAWDPKGAYALDADRPLTPASRQIVKDLMDAERGRAEALARYRLSVDKDDLVPAWTLSQIVRVKRQALAEYEREASKAVDRTATIPVLLYRLHVCRLAEAELPIAEHRTGNARWEKIRKDQKAYADRLRPSAPRSLGIAIGVTQVSLYWVVEDRRTLEQYRAAHPSRPDMRPLIAQAYGAGMHYGPVSTRFTDEATDPLEPRPTQSLKIAMDILRDRADDPLGHYYAGAFQFVLGHTDLAMGHMRAAMETHRLPPIYEQAARNFVAKPSYSALRPKVAY